MKFLADFRRLNPWLFDVGWLHVFLFILFASLTLFDQRTILGINPWIKPMKFALSIAVYLWTVGWLLSLLPWTLSKKKKFSWAFAWLMILEMALIALQSYRGVPSHFNLSSPFNGIVFAMMGLAILCNTLLIFYLLYSFIKDAGNVSAILRRGIVLGLIIFIFGSLIGAWMSSRLGHAVGVADGGPGIPFFNWSVTGGDYRIAHFLGLHALQIIPLVAWWIDRKSKPSFWLYVFAGIYAVATASLFFQAFQGIPLISG